MTRNEAILAGLKTYHTGRPCHKGHDALRYTSTGNCVECNKEKSGAYRRNLALAIAAGRDGRAVIKCKVVPEFVDALREYVTTLNLAAGRDDGGEFVTLQPARMATGGDIEDFRRRNGWPVS